MSNANLGNRPAARTRRKAATKKAGPPRASEPGPVSNPPGPRFCFRAVIHEAEEGGYWAEVPGFPGCVSEGETLDEVRANIREAFAGVLAVMQEDAPSEPGPVMEIPL
jgi:predicted RNase H-like HicB family nuclease